MNYFNQLLDSYTLLKKRKLKIRLEEQEKDGAAQADAQAEDKARKAAKDATRNTFRDPLIPVPNVKAWLSQGQKSVKNPQGIKYVVAALGAGSANHIADESGNPIEGLAWKRFVGAFKQKEPTKSPNGEEEEGAEEVQEVTPEIARETNRLITSISSFSAQLNNLAGAAERGIGVLTQRFKGMRDSAKRLEEGLHEQVLNSTDLQTNRN